MADIRINALATTAASTASDDFVAVDGSANGTRKLNAYSPTFGGNLTVSGTGTSSFAGPLKLTYGTNLTGTDIGLFATSGGGLYINAPTTKNIRLGFNLGDRMTLDENTATFATNLTVSGTGTSSFAGKIQTTSANGIEAIVGSGNTGLSLQSGSTQYSLYLNAADNSYRLYSSLGGDRFAVSSNGNFLIGGTTDGGNGNLQLKDTSGSSTKGIGFGLDTSLFRAASGNLCLNDSGTNAALSFYNAGTLRGYVFAQGSTTKFILGSLTAGWSTEIQSGNGTTALTLDSSQNATFANGLVAGKTSSVNTITGGDAGAGTSIISFKDGLGATKVNITGDGKMVLSNTTASTSTSTGALQVSGGVGVAGAVNVGGAIAIGNTVNTVSPTSPNRTITMVIGGTTYYIHAKTTND